MIQPPADFEPDRIDAYAQDTAHVYESLQLLYVQHRSKPLIRALLASFANRIQEIENAFWDLLSKTSLDTAFGDGLDSLGALLLFPRGQLSSDDDYRAVLRAAVHAIRSNGTGEDILAVLMLALGASFPFDYFGGFASVLIKPHQPLAISTSVVMKLLRMTKSAGVQLQMTTPLQIEAKLFHFSADPWRITTGAQGFSDTTQSSGGRLTGVVQ